MGIEEGAKRGRSLMEGYARELLRYRHALRSALAHRGIATNPGSTDDEIRQKLEDLLSVPPHACPDCRDV